MQLGSSHTTASVTIINTSVKQQSMGGMRSAVIKGKRSGEISLMGTEEEWSGEISPMVLVDLV